MAAAILLSVVIGLALGLLGGGGSILTVPILIYAVHLPPKVAIATSLLVVSVTSAAALIPHARAGRVRWRTALVFGGTGMAGAYAGGRLAQLVPAQLLLIGFAVMMLLTAFAMIRGRTRITPEPGRGARPVGRIALEGTAVGLVTGMVGAGGGFLVVPALVLLGGMPMSAAVGTSLAVIAMKSAAGFAGYLGHVQVPWGLAAAVSAAAVVGSVAGSRLAGRVPERWLRPLFGWFVVVMAAFVLGRQLPDGLRESPLYQAIFVERWPWWASGAAIGAIVLGLLWYDNKLLGVSTGCAELCQVRKDATVRRSWRLLFLAGIALGGVAAALLGGGACMDRPPEPKPSVPFRGMERKVSVLALDLTNGRELWKRPVDARYAQVASDGRIVLLAPSGEFGSDSPSTEIVCLDARTGKERWKKAIPDHVIALGVDDKLAYSVGLKLRALSLQDGTPAWAFETVGPRGEGGVGAAAALGEFVPQQMNGLLLWLGRKAIQGLDPVRGTQSHEWSLPEAGPESRSSRCRWPSRSPESAWSCSSARRSAWRKGWWSSSKATSAESRPWPPVGERPSSPSPATSSSRALGPCRGRPPRAKA